MRRRLLFAALLLLLVVCAAAAAALFLNSPRNVSHPSLSFTAPKAPPAPKPVQADTFLWPRYGYDGARTRFFDPGPKLAPPFRIGWRFQDYALLEFSPVIYGTTLYIDDDDASAKAIDKRTGAKLWERKLGTLAAASPAISLHEKVVIVPILSRHGNVPGDGAVFALSMQTGQIVWQRSLPAGSESSPIVWGDTVYFGDQSGAVYSMRASDGHVNWIYHASDAVKGGPALANGILYFGDYAGRAYALDAASGREIWAVSTSGTHFGLGSGNFYSTPAVAFGRVYMGNTDGRVYSFAARTGALAWATDTGAYVYASPAVADVPGLGPTVYLGSYDGNFYAFNAQSGAIRWSHADGGRISGSPTIVGNVVYYSGLGSRSTTGLDLHTGRVVFSMHDGAFNPVVADSGAIYLTGYSMIYQLLPNRPSAKPLSPTPKSSTAKAPARAGTPPARANKITG